MSEHSPEFITSEFTVSTDDADKIAAVKAALAANVHFHSEPGFSQGFGD